GARRRGPASPYAFGDGQPTSDFRDFGGAIARGHREGPRCAFRRPRCLSEANAHSEHPACCAGHADPMTAITVELNGVKVNDDVEPRQTLADFLRDRCGLTATHLGCEHGACGACTVEMDGQPTRACLALAAMCDGRSIVTLEGLRDDPAMEVLRKHFHQCPALQCGF